MQIPRCIAGGDQHVLWGCSSEKEGGKLQFVQIFKQCIQNIFRQSQYWSQGFECHAIWAQENQHPILRWYIDAGWSGRTFDRPKFRKLIADIERGEVDCVVVKDLSRLGRDHIAVGYYLEVFFPMNCVRFVSINDYFDTVDGLTDQSNPHGSRIRIPIKNAFNEQVAAEIKQKVEATLQMKENVLLWMKKNTNKIA